MRAILTRAQLHALCISSAPLQFSSVNGLAALSMVFEILSNHPHHNMFCSHVLDDGLFGSALQRLWVGYRIATLDKLFRPSESNRDWLCTASVRNGFSVC